MYGNRFYWAKISITRGGGSRRLIIDPSSFPHHAKGAKTDSSAACGSPEHRCRFYVCPGYSDSAVSIFISPLYWRCRLSVRQDPVTSPAWSARNLYRFPQHRLGIVPGRSRRRVPLCTTRDIAPEIDGGILTANVISPASHPTIKLVITGERRPPDKVTGTGEVECPRPGY